MKLVDRIKSLLQNAEQLIHHNLLSVDAAERSHLRKGYRLVYYTLRGVNVHRTMVDSAALTLYTLLALVPVLTLALLILRKIDVVDRCVPLIYSSVPDKWHAMLDNLLATANGAVENIAPGFLAIVGIAMLIFMVFALFRTVEGSFNRVFNVVDSRSFIHRYMAYVIIALFVPTLLLSAMTFAYDLLAMVGLGDGVNDVVGSITSTLSVMVAAMLMYKYLPYTNVGWRNALYAGSVAGVSLSLWMSGYVYFQQMMTAYNIIYGSLAALPLFIIWLQVSWNIILVGCELCAVWQYRDRYEYIDRRRIKVAVANDDSVTSVVVVGSGNVAEAFARTLSKCEDMVLRQIFSRNEERGRAIAEIADTMWCGDMEMIAPADIYIIAVSDRAVADVAASLNVPADSIVVHTAGSVPMDAIAKREGGRGIIYPLQSFTSGREVCLSDVPLFIESDNTATTERLMRIASHISSRVEYADSERRRVIHLAGVYVNNFVNHLYAVGDDVVERAGLDFDVLKPLIRETAAKAIASSDPRSVQTGPAVRGDVVVTERHMAMLKDKESKQKIYKYITESIWETSKKI
ncbi:MAG: YihY family inner membrane protein [Alistipes sp.]|nr:YihY family inner membrane protein [Alistipes sp.]